MRNLILYMCLCMLPACAPQKMHYPCLAVLGESLSNYYKVKLKDAIIDFNFRVGTPVLEENIDSPSTIYIEYIKEFEDDNKKDNLLTIGRAMPGLTECTIHLSEWVLGTNEALQPVLWHEVGHCMGLLHIEPKGEIMYKTLTLLPFLEQDAMDRFFNQVRKIINEQ